jgi:hypothetical protein
MTARQQGETWLEIDGDLVSGEVPVDKITDEMLDHDHCGNPWEIWWHLFFIRCRKWVPVEPARRNETPCLIGTVKELALCGDGDICIEVTPDAPYAGMMRPGQTTIECELPWAKRNDGFRMTLTRLRVGTRVEICGYHVVDRGHDGNHELHPVTGLVRLY